MIPKPERPDRPANTPTRADASVITAGLREEPSGFGVITNSLSGKLAKRARTGKTVTTGGSSNADN